MTHAIETVQRELVDARNERLFSRVGMCVVVVVLVLVNRSAHGQAFDLTVFGEFDAIDVHPAVDDLAAKAAKSIGGVVARHPAVHSVVPSVHAANQVCPGDMAVGQQGTAVATSPGQHAVLVVPSNEDEIDAIDEACGRSPVSELIPLDDLHRVDKLRRPVDGRTGHFETRDSVHDGAVSSDLTNVSSSAVIAR